MLLRHSIVLLSLLLSIPSSALAQRTGIPAADDAGRARVDAGAPIAAAPEPALPPELEQLLQRWADASSQIKRLEGEHLRREYDTTFGVEKVSEGRFWYEAPDKGRIDVTPTEITPRMQKERLEPDAQVRRKKDGTPFDLQSGRPEKWICDGVRVFEIKEEDKSASVGQLPPDMQGAGIMNSPLPFLFGLPPEQAKARFQLSFSQPFDPNSGVAYIRALPRKEQDARSWRQADVLLNLQTFLPVAIQLIDPAGTGVTVYRFSDLEPNLTVWKRKPTEWFTDYFKPDLRGYNVVVIPGGPGPAPIAGGGGRVAQVPQGNGGQPVGPVVPNFQGIHYEAAIKSLGQFGLNRQNKTILLNQGPPATQPGDLYRVHSQHPAPGTPVNKDTVVTLFLWTKADGN